jgi:GH25 family lysozyme M1 (1,4-beta-N-acetylmuramidase)
VQNANGDHAMGATIPSNESSPTSTLNVHSFAATAATGPSSTFPKGFDISAYQANSSINWSSVVKNGAKFVYMKATEGTTYKSSQFTAQWTSATNAGLTRGAYVFAQPAEASGASTANYFYSNGGGWSNDGRTLPPLLDIEYGSAAQGTCYGLSKSAMVSWISSFTKQMHSLTGRYPAIYTTTDWWTQCTGNSKSFSSDPFFVAHYTNATTPGTLGGSWSTWNMWQWADSGTFPGDQDVFNGTASGLSSFAATKAVPVSTAIGHVDGVTNTYGAISVRGWAADTTTTASTKVAVQVDGTATMLTASASRPDVGAAYPTLGSAHGFSTTVSATAGTHSVCVVAYTAKGTATTSLGCTTVTVASASPHGSFDSAVATPSGVVVSGWAIDPETTGSINVTIGVDGKATKTVAASASRSDVAKAYPAYGAKHGFSVTLTGLSATTHKITVTAINTGRGSNAALGTAKSVRVAGNAPVGSLDKATASGSSISIAGWTIDGNTTSSITERTYIDGKAHSLTANQSRTDIAKIFPDYGAAHGFSATYAAGVGKHTVCVYGINAGAGTTNTNLSGTCKTVTVTNQKPVGSLDSVKTSPKAITVAGWSIDPNTTASISVRTFVDGKKVGTVTANGTRNDVAKAYPSFGAKHGYTAKYATTAGSHKVCSYGLDSAGGSSTTLGCKTVTVSS